MHIALWKLKYRCNSHNYNMILSILLLSISITTFSIFLAQNPLTLGLIILIMALLLAITFAYAISSWIAFLIFLIYIGGIIVIFSYFVSIIPNQTLYIFYNIIIITLSIFIILLLSSYINIKPFIVSSQPVILNFMYTQKNIPMLIFIALLLLFTIIVVVKLTILSKGPLRPFNSYV